jgi:hypothetical protein
MPACLSGVVPPFEDEVLGLLDAVGVLRRGAMFGALAPRGRPTAQKLFLEEIMPKSFGSRSTTTVAKSDTIVILLQPVRGALSWSTSMKRRGPPIGSYTPVEECRITAPASGGAGLWVNSWVYDNIFLR